MMKKMTIPISLNVLHSSYLHMAKRSKNIVRKNAVEKRRGCFGVISDMSRDVFVG